jgi:hypothetical protein
MALTPFETILAAGNSDTVSLYRPASNANAAYGYNDRTCFRYDTGVEVMFRPDTVGDTVLPGGALAGSVGAIVQVTPVISASLRTGDLVRTEDGEFWRVTGPPKYSKLMAAYTWMAERVAYVSTANASSTGDVDPLVPVLETLVTRSVNGTFTAGQSTATFDTSAHLVAPAATVINVVAIWNGTILDDDALTIASDRRSVTVLLPLDPLGDNPLVDRLTFTTGDTLRLRYVAAD